MSTAQAVTRPVLTRTRWRACLAMVLVAVAVLFTAFRCEPLRKPIPQTAGISHTIHGVAHRGVVRDRAGLTAWGTFDASRLDS
jgi:hypothetical protein